MASSPLFLLRLNQQKNKKVKNMQRLKRLWQKGSRPERARNKEEVEHNQEVAVTERRIYKYETPSSEPVIELPVELWAAILSFVGQPRLIAQLLTSSRPMHQLLKHDIVWKAIHDSFYAVEAEKAVPSFRWEEPLSGATAQQMEHIAEYKHMHEFPGYSYWFSPDQYPRNTIFEDPAKGVNWRAAVLKRAEEHKRNEYKPILIKVVAMGDLGVGKTSLLMRFCTNKFVEQVPVVFRNYTAHLYYHQRNIALSLWDTEMWDTSFMVESDRQRDILDGGEDYTGMRLLTYPNTDTFLLCFSLIKKKSLEKIQQRWLADIHRYALWIGYTLVLCGTQCDVVDKRQVSHDDALAVAKKIGAYAYIEVSALTGEGVDIVVQACIDSVRKAMPLQHPLSEGDKDPSDSRGAHYATWADPFYGSGQCVIAPYLEKKGLWSYWSEDFGRGNHMERWKEMGREAQHSFSECLTNSDYLKLQEEAQDAWPLPEKRAEKKSEKSRT